MFVETKTHGYVNSDKITNFCIEAFSAKECENPAESGIFHKIKDEVEMEFKAHDDIGFLVCAVAYIEDRKYPAIIDYKHSHSDGEDAYLEMAKILLGITVMLNSHA